MAESPPRCRASLAASIGMRGRGRPDGTWEVVAEWHGQVRVVYGPTTLFGVARFMNETLSNLPATRR